MSKSNPMDDAGPCLACFVCLLALGLIALAITFTCAFWNVPQYLLTTELKEENKDLYNYIEAAYYIYWISFVYNILQQQAHKACHTEQLHICCTYFAVLIVLTQWIIAFCVLWFSHGPSSDTEAIKPSWVNTCFTISIWFQAIFGMCYACQITQRKDHDF